MNAMRGLTDHQLVMDMLARANHRYHVVVHSGGSDIVSHGIRAVGFPTGPAVHFEFDADGSLRHLRTDQ